VFEFFRGGRDKAPSPDSQLADTVSAQSTVAGTSSTPQHTATHRELTRVVLRDTLRLNGIPAEWIGCEILARPQSRSLLIQLVIHKWHEGLLRYAPLLQQQLLQGLQRFDPASDHTGHLVVWKFAPDCDCPHTAMPAPQYWSAPAAMETSKPKFDLPPSAYDSRGDDDFAPTVPSELR